MTYNQFTIEEINEKLKDKKIKLTGKYVNTKTNTEFTCLICGNKFTSKYELVKVWTIIGCKKCNNKEILTHDERMKRKKDKLVNSKTDTIEIISCDKDINRINCRCLICGEEYETSYASLVRGNGHRPCSMRKIALKQLTSEEEVKARVLSFGNDIDIDFSNYNSANDLLDCKCNACGNKWKARQRNLIRGRGCPVCSNEKRKASKFIPLDECNKVLSKFNLELISDYVAASYPIIVRCKQCNNTFSTTISYLKNCGIGCVECNNEIRIKERYKLFSESLLKLNSRISMVDKFVGMGTPIHFYCSGCKKTFFRTPHDFLKTPTCPNCTTNSALEYFVKIYLEDNNIDYKLHKSYDDLFGVNGGKLSYDFLLPKYNLLIECQGEQHEVPNDYFGGEKAFKIQVEHDKRKREYALKNNINLLEIWYYDEKNINEILDKKLYSIKNQKSA